MCSSTQSSHAPEHSNSVGPQHSEGGDSRERERGSQSLRADHAWAPGEERGGRGASEGQQGQRRPREGNGGQSLEGSKASTDSKHFTRMFVGSLWGLERSSDLTQRLKGSPRCQAEPPESRVGLGARARETLLFQVTLVLESFVSSPNPAGPDRRLDADVAPDARRTVGVQSRVRRERQVL